MPACPRYCPERTLPVERFLPGRGVRPSTEGQPERQLARWDGNTQSLQANREYLWGVDLYNHGFYWEAHEAWEELWKQSQRNTVHRHVLQGLIQCAAAALKASMNHPMACHRLAQKGLAHLHHGLDAPSGHCLGIDVRAFATQFHEYSVSTHRLTTPPKLLIASG